MRYKNEQVVTSRDNDNIIEWVFPAFKKYIPTQSSLRRWNEI